MPVYGNRNLFDAESETGEISREMFSPEVDSAEETETYSQRVWGNNWDYMISLNATPFYAGQDNSAPPQPWVELLQAARAIIQPAYQKEAPRFKEYLQKGYNKSTDPLFGEFAKLKKLLHKLQSASEDGVMALPAPLQSVMYDLQAGVQKFITHTDALLARNNLQLQTARLEGEPMFLLESLSERMGQALNTLNSFRAIKGVFDWGEHLKEMREGHRAQIIENTAQILWPLPPVEFNLENHQSSHADILNEAEKTDASVIFGILENFRLELDNLGNSTLDNEQYKSRLNALINNTQDKICKKTSSRYLAADVSNSLRQIAMERFMQRANDILQSEGKKHRKETSRITKLDDILAKDAWQIRKYRKADLDRTSQALTRVAHRAEQLALNTIKDMDARKVLTIKNNLPEVISDARYSDQEERDKLALQMANIAKGASDVCQKIADNFKQISRQYLPEEAQKENLWQVMRSTWDKSIPRQDSVSLWQEIKVESRKVKGKNRDMLTSWLKRGEKGLGMATYAMVKAGSKIPGGEKNLLSERFTEAARGVSYQLLEAVQQFQELLKVYSGEVLGLRDISAHCVALEKNQATAPGNVLSNGFNAAFDLYQRVALTLLEEKKTQQQKRVKELLTLAYFLANNPELKTNLLTELQEETSAVDSKSVLYRPFLQSVAGNSGALLQVAATFAKHADEALQNINNENWETSEFKALQEGLRGTARIKANIKIALYLLMGRTVHNFSRRGRLSRGIASWAQELKATFLEQYDQQWPNDKRMLSAVFDQALRQELYEQAAFGMTAKEEHSSFLTSVPEQDTSGKEDNGLFFSAALRQERQKKNAFPVPDKKNIELFLRRVKIALQHAEYHRLLHPPTPEQLLESLYKEPNYLRRQAAKKVVNSPLSALTSLLLYGSISAGGGVPTGVITRGIFQSFSTAWSIWNTGKAMDKGVRYGQRAAKEEKTQMQELKLRQLGTKLAVTAGGPLIEKLIAAAITGHGMLRVPGYYREFAKSTFAELPETLFWQSYGMTTGYSTSLIVKDINRLLYQKQFDVFLAKLEKMWEEQKLSTALDSNPVGTEENVAVGAVQLPITGRSPARFADKDEVEEAPRRRKKRSAEEGVGDKASGSGHVTLPPVGIKNFTEELTDHERSFTGKIIGKYQFSLPRGKSVEQNSERLALEWYLKTKWHDKNSIFILPQHIKIEEGTIYASSRTPEPQLYLYGHFWKILSNQNDQALTIENSSNEKLDIIKNADHIWILEKSNIAIKEFFASVVDYDKYPAHIRNLIKKEMDTILLQEGENDYIKYLLKMEVRLGALFYKNYKHATPLDMMYLLKARQEIISAINKVPGLSEVSFGINHDLQKALDEGPDQEWFVNFNQLFLPEVIDNTRYSAVIAGKKEDDSSIQELERQIAIARQEFENAKTKGRKVLSEGAHKEEADLDALVFEVYFPHLEKKYFLQSEMNELILQRENEQKAREPYRAGISYAEEALQSKKMSGKNDADALAEILNDIVIQEIETINDIAELNAEQKEKKLKWLRVAKHHIHFRININAVYAEVRPQLKQNTYPAKGNSLDITTSKVEATKLYLHQKSKDAGDISDEEYLYEFQNIINYGSVQDSQKLNWLMMGLFYKINHPGQNLDAVDPYSILIFYDKKSLEYFNNLYVFNKKLPENYLALDKVMPGENFLETKDYYNQFNDYITKGSSDFDAQSLTPFYLAGLNISQEDRENPPQAFYKFSPVLSKPGGQVYHHRGFNANSRTVTPLPGSVFFIKLHSGNYIVVSSISGSITTEVINQERIKKESPVLANALEKQVIAQIPLTSHTFLNTIYYSMFDEVDTWGYTDFELRPEKITTKKPDSLKMSMKLALQSQLETMADTMKVQLINKGTAQKIAEVLVPFYKVIYNSIVDYRYKVDLLDLMTDTLSVLMTLVGTGIQLTRLGQATASAIMKVILEERAKGLFGMRLVRAVAGRVVGIVADAGLATGKVLLNSAREIIDPTPLSEIAMRMMSNIRLPTKSASALGRMNQGVSLDLSMLPDKNFSIKNLLTSFNDKTVGEYVFTRPGFGFDASLYEDVRRGSQFYEKFFPEVYVNDKQENFAGIVNQLTPNKKMQMFLDANNQNLKLKRALYDSIQQDFTIYHSYNVAAKAGKWERSAISMGAEKALLAPQDLFLWGKKGECLPESILMSFALEQGKEVEFINRLMALRKSVQLEEAPLYKDLKKLHEGTNAFSFDIRDRDAKKIDFIQASHEEEEFFINGSDSVRVDIPGHSMSMTRIKRNNNASYVFYDPNYGMAYFHNYQDMMHFFKENTIKGYKVAEQNVICHALDFSKEKLEAIKINGKNLSNIVETAAYENSERLNQGDMSVFYGKGYLGVKENKSITTPFEYVRFDNSPFQQPQPTPFTTETLQSGGELESKVSVTTGENLTTDAAGAWNSSDNFTNNVEFIHIRNGDSGTLGIRIALDKIPEGKTVVVSAGKLSGCTMLYATDNHYFYAYHAGKRPGDNDWLTSQQGVNTLYQSHLALTGKVIPHLKAGNNGLLQITDTYNSSTINYLGKKVSMPGTSNAPPVDTHITDQGASGASTAIFDYNAEPAIDARDKARLGVAYAVLSRVKGKVKVNTFSDDLAIPIGKEGKIESLAMKEHNLMLNVAEAETRPEFKENSNTSGSVGEKVLPSQTKGSETESGLKTQPATHTLAIQEAGPPTSQNVKLTYTNPYLQALVDAKPGIEQKINNPAGQSWAVRGDVSVFMAKQGFEEIRYRVVYIWHEKNRSPVRHLVLLGKNVSQKGHPVYVFDITAHQFKEVGMPKLDEPLVVTEQEWRNKYEMKAATKYIVYCDFNDPEAALWAKYTGDPLGIFEPGILKNTPVTLVKPNWYGEYATRGNFKFRRVKHFPPRY